MSPPARNWGGLDYEAVEAARLQLVTAKEFGLLRFSDAAKVWLAEKRREISASTYKNYQHILIPLEHIFGQRPLNTIDHADVEGYQIWRQKPWFDESSERTFRAGYSPINHEVSCLGQIMGRAGLWLEIAKFYKPLPQPKSQSVGVLEPKEEARLVNIGDTRGYTNPYWQVAYCAAMLTMNTTAGWGEIRHLHMNDLQLKRIGGDGKPMPTLTIRDGLKNQHRDRILYLNGTAKRAVEILVERAERLGCQPDSEHFLLPHCAERAREPADPNRPMISCKRAFRAMCKKAELPKLKYHHLRRHAITRILENPRVSEQTALEISGQVTKKMQNHYSHIRMEPKREALEAAETIAPSPQRDFDFEAVALPPAKRPASARAKIPIDTPLRQG